MRENNKNLRECEVIFAGEKNTASKNDPQQSKNQDAKIRFDQNLANQEWINERDFIRYRLFGASITNIITRVLPMLPADIGPFFTLHHNHVSYYIHQNKFEKSLPLGNRIFSIDTSFAANIKYNQMFKQKYFVGVKLARVAFYSVINAGIKHTAYMRSHVMTTDLYQNQEISKLMENDNNDLVGWANDTNEGLDSKSISVADRKKFNNITSDFFDLPNTHMKSVAEFLIKHKSYGDTFFVQGLHSLSLNLNGNNTEIDGYEKDFHRNNLFGQCASGYDPRKRETLSYYSRCTILCFFRPEYLFSNEKPDSKLVEFYVALNSLLSTQEKENAKAILNADEKKLTEQQGELKKKLSGEDEKFRNNIINAWKDGFFLDKSKIEKSDNLFKDKEKKFRDAFYKNRAIDLIIEIENGNLKLMLQRQNKDLKNDLSSKDNNDDKINFLIEQLFNGAGIFVKNNNEFLTLMCSKRNEYSSKDLSEKLTLIDTIINKLPPKTALIYNKKNEFVKIIDWLISEIENGNLNLISQGQKENLNDGLSNKNNNDKKVSFLVEKLFSGARIVAKDSTPYLEFSTQELVKYSTSNLDEKLKLIDKKIQFCPTSAKMLKPSDFDSGYFDYQHIANKRLSELLYFTNDEQKRDYIYLRENKDYYRDYILHQDYGENELYNELYQCTQKADFGKYKREHFIFDETGKIMGMDVLAYFADKIVSRELKLKDNKGKDISGKVKNIDNDLAREVFLMDKLTNDTCSIFDGNENKEIKMSFDDTLQRTLIVTELKSTIQNLRIIENKEYIVNENAINGLFSSLYSDDGTNKTMKDFIKMFRLEKEDVEEIVKDKHQPHALMYRYALNKIFTEKINPVDKQNKTLIGGYIFDFSKAECGRDDLVFSKDGRVEYVKSESLPRVLKLDSIKKLELQVRNDFIKNYNYEASNNIELQKKIIDAFAYFADEIDNNKLILKNDKGKDVSDEIKNTDSNKSVFLVKKLAEDGYSVCCSKDGKTEIKFNGELCEDLVSELKSTMGKLKIDGEKVTANKDAIKHLFNNSFSNGNKTMKDFIRMFRLKEKDVEEIVVNTDELNLMIYIYALKKTFAEKININKKKDSEVAKNELERLRENLDSNACTNLNDFYDPDSYLDEFLDEYIKFYQNAKIGYEYWCSECAKKFLKDEKAKKEKNNDEIADIELKFLKGQKIEPKGLSQYTQQNKKQEITSIIELQKFRNREIGYENLSQYTKDNKEKGIAEIEFKLLKENKLMGDRKTIRQLQKQKSKFMSLYYRLASGKINNRDKLKKINIYGETILYFLEDTESQQLDNDIDTLKRQNIDLYKSKNIPYKHWDFDAKEDYFNKLQWKWFKIGCIPLSILILSVVSFFPSFIEGYLVIKIIFTSGSFVCGCLVSGKGIKNKKDLDYRGRDTYDNIDYNYPNDNFVKPNLNNVDLKADSISNENINIDTKDMNIISTSLSSSGMDPESEDIPNLGQDDTKSEFNKNRTNDN